MSFTNRYPLNVPGKYYVDDQCLDCDLCRELSPNNIRRDDRYGHSYVFKQPENDEEIELLREGVEGCPMGSVRDDGDQYDWTREPMTDWNERMRRGGHDIQFEVTVPIVPLEESDAPQGGRRKK